MRLVLDDERLNGPHTAWVSLRPRRVATLVAANDMSSFLAAIELNCQRWGGAASPIIPVSGDGKLQPLWADLLPGAAIDAVPGLRLDLYRAGDVIDELPAVAPQFRDQFAPMFFDERRTEDDAGVTTYVLADDDPWRPIYAACLGFWPESPSRDLLDQAQLRTDLSFERFVTFERISATGSRDDLLGRVSDWSLLHPRRASMMRLASGMAPNTGLRSGSQKRLPDARFEASDAGPNVVVVCTAGSVEDLALLWNLRAAHGDSYAAPIGILIDQFDAATLEILLRAESMCHQGMPHRQLYVTSTTVPLADLAAIIASNTLLADEVSAVAPAALATFGPAPGRRRTEVTVWSDGRTTIVPLSSEDRATLPLRGRTWSDLDLRFDVKVEDSPFPDVPDLRIGSFNDEFYGGANNRNASEAVRGVEIEWPSRALVLRGICAERGLVVTSSEPGRACLTFLESLQHGISDISLFAHEPLLTLLDDMAQRAGTAWAKAHLRRLKDQPDSPTELRTVAPVEDDLPEVPFNRFVGALGSNKAAISWLAWAENRRVVIKGFPIECDKCGAKQWVPIAGFAPPIACRGCARVIDRPFPRETVSFKYRLGESLRRVFEHDAMGHLLVMRYFTSLMSFGNRSSLVGGHPGLDVATADGGQRIGEADVLLLTRAGRCIPIEVKRSFKGVDATQVGRLDTLVAALDAPWSVVAVPRWGTEATTEFVALGEREAAGHHRLLLTYDHLLSSAPVQSLGDDPYAWVPMDADEIAERQRRFTKSVESMRGSTRSEWFTEEVLARIERRRRPRP
jgi:hypothetical protein